MLSLLPMFHFLHRKSALLLTWVLCFTVLNSFPALAGKCGSKQAECLEADFGEPNINRVNRIELPRFGAPLEREQETKRVLLDLSIPTALISLIGEYLAIPAVRIVSNERGLAITVGDSLFVTDEEEKNEKKETTAQAYPFFSEVQLPLDRTDEKASPVKISGLAATSTCMFIMTGKGGVFGWGVNHCGVLGSSTPFDVQSPVHPIWISFPAEDTAQKEGEEKNEEKNQEKVRLVGVQGRSNSVVIAVTESKKIVVWGNSTFGLLCKSEADFPTGCSTPLAIRPLEGKDVIFLETSAQKVFFAATENAVYGWGDDITQLAGSDSALPHIVYEMKAPTDVKIQSLKVLDRGNGGSLALLILGDNGRVYKWGCGCEAGEHPGWNSGLLCNRSFRPVKIPESERVTDLQVDSHERGSLWYIPRAFALTDLGNIYRLGYESLLERPYNTFTVRAFQLLPGGAKITHIAPGLDGLFWAEERGTLWQENPLGGGYVIWKSPLGGDSIQSLTVSEKTKSNVPYLLILLNDGSLFIKQQVEGQNIRQGLSESEKVQPFFHHSG